MINVKFYKNGFEINGHSQHHICSAVSALSWACGATICDLDDDCSHEYYGSHMDNSNAGYSYLEFDNSSGKANQLFNDFKTNIVQWCEELYPQEVSFEYSNDVLKVPDNFKELKGISAK